jgi:hypothetical protein
MSAHFVHHATTLILIQPPIFHTGRIFILSR